MDRLIPVSIVLLLALMLAVSSWAQCPEDTVDRGECDTLHVICLDCEEDTVAEDFYLVRFPLLVTHDQTQPVDSICGFVLPLTFTHSNPAAYCSVSDYWNRTWMLWVFPDFSTRSIFRHIVEGSDTLYHNRMAVLDGDWSNRGWDTAVLDLDGSSNFCLAVIATGPDVVGKRKGIACHHDLQNTGHYADLLGHHFFASDRTPGVREV